MNVKDIRRENLRSLAQSIGGITALAKKLKKSQSQISHLIGIRPIKKIGDRLADEIEKAFEKAHGWLDKEHFRVSGQENIYVIANDAPRPLSWVPILDWDDAIVYEQFDKLNSSTSEYVPIGFEVSPQTFALRVENDMMDAPLGLSFPKGTVIIVDPSHIATDSSFVLVTPLEKGDKPIFSQLIHEHGGHKSLKLLNPRYESFTLADNQKIIGVIRTLTYKIE